MNFKKFLNKHKLTKKEKLEEFIQTQKAIGQSNQVLNLIHFSNWDNKPVEHVKSVYEETITNFKSKENNNNIKKSELSCF